MLDIILPLVRRIFNKNAHLFIVMPHYLVTGGAGFIGSTCAKRLLEEGYDVRIIDNLSTGRKELIPEGAEFLELDLVNLDAIRNAFKGIDGVFHFAAMPRVPYTIEHPVESSRNNIFSTLNALVAARDAGVKRFVYSASSSAYGGNPELPQHPDMKPDPLSPYALQKLIGEYYCTLFADLYGLETASLRYFNVYGPNMAEEGAYVTVISIFKQQKQSGKSLTIFGDGKQTRSFCHVKDVVQANLMAMQSPHVGKGEILNVSGTTAVSVNDIAKRFNHPIEYFNPRSGDPKHSLGDISKTTELLGWKPQISFDEGFKDLMSLWGIDYA